MRLPLPQVKSFGRKPGYFRLPEVTKIRVPDEWRNLPEGIIRLYAWKKTSVAVDADADLSIQIDHKIHKEGYTLEISPTGITIHASTSPGAFYGTVTLLQLIHLNGKRLECCTIKDYPDLAIRGFYHDVSRGKIPTFGTLEELVFTAAFYKLNHLELYVEHVFPFSAITPELTEGKDILSAEELKTLDSLCALLHIDFTPSLSTFGHMFEILNLPKWRHLAEIPDEVTLTWAKGRSVGRWIERMGHHTIDPTNPQSRELLGSMIDEYIPCFSSKNFNICCDETFDLGRGRSRASGKSAVNLYIEHVRWLHSLLAERYGKQVYMWGDIILHHPELLKMIPKDIIVLNWDYSPDVTERSTVAYAHSGFRQILCPGVIGWNHLVNMLDDAEKNISKMCAYAKKHKTLGILNTDWGDYGHVNPLTSSLPGLAFGAACSWGRTPQRKSFDRTFSLLQWDDPEEVFIKSIRAMGKLPLWWNLFNEPAGMLVRQLMENKKETRYKKIRKVFFLEKSRMQTNALIETVSKKSPLGRETERKEILAALETLLLHCDRFQILRDRATGKRCPMETMQKYHEQIEKTTQVFTEAWLRRNRRTDLDLILQSFKESAP